MENKITKIQENALFNVECLLQEFDVESSLTEPCDLWFKCGGIDWRLHFGPFNFFLMHVTMNRFPDYVWWPLKKSNLLYFGEDKAVGPCCQCQGQTGLLTEHNPTYDRLNLLLDFLKNVKCKVP